MTEPRILLADDSDVGRYVIATMLRRAGFDVSETADGAETVRAAVEDTPDLIVLDVKMPVMDGFEACRRLRAHEATRHLPILLLSATFLETEAQVEGLETGADAYLTQPVEAPVLTATIRSLLRSRAAESEVRLAEKEWRATFDAISDAVAVLAADGRVLRANRPFSSLFGAPPSERVPELAGLHSGDELEHHGRTFSVSVDRIVDTEVHAGQERDVVTLTDVTASRAIERQRAEALANERRISRTLQQSLLPERFPHHPRLRLHAWHVAAETELIVGGDWYDVIETEHGVWLVIGDIAGHGVAATASAGRLRHSLRVYAHEGYDLVGCMQRLNELVLAEEPHQMATVCIVSVDREAEELRYVLAGHPPPLHVPAEGSPLYADGDSGVVLGIAGARFEESALRIAPGDRLVLYTDGLIERPEESIDDGLDRMRRAAGEAAGLHELRAHLVNTLTGGTDLRDDVALLLAERV